MDTPMEQHPVPQNVTTFQFRLIGDMTIKQFAYLAGGALFGYIFYKSPLPVFLGLPLGVATLLLGFGFAFVPVEERPMDVWFFSFIKSIYSPTLYVWQREKTAAPSKNQPAATHTQPSVGAPPPLTAPPKPQPPPTPKQEHTKAPVQPPAAPPAILSSNIKPKTRPAGLSLFGWFSTLFSIKSSSKRTQPPVAPPAPKQPAPKPQTIPEMFGHMTTPSITGQGVQQTEDVAHAPLPYKGVGQTVPQTPEPTTSEQEQTEAKIEAAAEKTKELESKLEGLQGELSKKTASEDRIVELQKQLTVVLSERDQMQKELAALKNKLEKVETAPAPAAPMYAGTTTAPAKGPTVKIITADAAVRAGLPRLTTFPNVVTGIIKDNTGNLLPGVLVTVRDKEDIPVRALKTNKLGQFAASTPLPNNTYFVEVEDPRNRYVFDRMQITLNGSVVPAVEVVAKSQKELSREKLEKQIFGAPNI